VSTYLNYTIRQKYRDQYRLLPTLKGKQAHGIKAIEPPTGTHIGLN
jgi:hypothetical protein